MLLLGAVVGAMCAGVPADRLGRKPSIMISAVLFCVGCVLSSYAAVSLGVLILGRLVLGLAIGVTSSVTPLFIAVRA